MSTCVLFQGKVVFFSNAIVLEVCIRGCDCAYRRVIPHADISGCIQIWQAGILFISEHYHQQTVTTSSSSTSNRTQDLLYNPVLVIFNRSWVGSLKIIKCTFIPWRTLIALSMLVVTNVFSKACFIFKNYLAFLRTLC